MEERRLHSEPVIPNRLRVGSVTEDMEKAAQRSKDQQGGRKNRRGGKLLVAAVATSIVGTGIFAVGGALRGTDGASADSGQSSAPSLATTEKPSAAGSTPTPDITPTIKPSNSPEVSPLVTPEASPEVKLEDFNLTNGMHMEVFPGDIISGDVSMSDTEVLDITNLEEVKQKVRALYDSDLHRNPSVTDVAKTALFVDVQTHGWVYAENGGFVKRGLTGENRQTTLALWRVQKINSGFNDANVVTWTGHDTTVDQAGLISNGQPGEVNVDINKPVSLDNIKADEAVALLKLIEDSKLDLTIPVNKQLVLDLMQCIACVTCGTTETPAPSQTPKPSSTPETVCIPWKDEIMDKGEKKTFKVNGFTALGDDWISINGGNLKRYYDGNAKTAAVERKWFGKPTEVTVWSKEGGTNFKGFNNCATKDDWITQVADDIKVTKNTGRKIDPLSLR